MQQEKTACLALHLSGKFLTERVRRQYEIAGSVLSLARVLLAERCESALAAATTCLNGLRDCSTICLTDADYPRMLAETDYAPFTLFIKGNRAIISDKLVSIVGTREPSDAGRQASAAIAAFYAQSGCTVVSGIARGIDSIAHHAALSAGGRTIAVLPNGFDHAYPLENRDLYAAAATSDRILLVSEYPPEQKPQKHHFVRRNRIIAGLAEMTIFAEGNRKSGAMITANHALKEGREVAALCHKSLLNNAGGEMLCADGAIDLTARFLPN